MRTVRASFVSGFLAVTSVAFSLVAGQQVGLPATVVLAAAAAGVAIFSLVFDEDHRLICAMPASVIAIGGIVSPDALGGVGVVAGGSALALAFFPAITDLAQRAGLTGAVRSATAGGLLTATAGWATGGGFRRAQDILHADVDRAALVAAACGLAVAIAARRSTVVALSWGAATATLVGLVLGAPVIGPLTVPATHLAQGGATPVLVVAVGIVLGGLIATEATAAAEVVGSRPRRVVAISGFVTVVTGALLGVPAIAPAVARTKVAQDLKANQRTAGAHLGLVVVIATTAVAGALVGGLPLVGVAVPVAVSAVGLIDRNMKSFLVVVAAATLGVAVGLVVGVTLGVSLYLFLDRRDGRAANIPSAVDNNNDRREEVMAAA